MKHILLTIHGVNTSPTPPNWQERLSAFVYQHSIEFVCYNYKYGRWLGILPWISTFPSPFLAKWIRKGYTSSLKKYIRFVRKTHPEAQLHIVAHSFGTWLIHEILLDPTIHIDSCHLVAGVVHRNLGKNKLDDAVLGGNVRRVYVYSSKKDRVVQLAPPPFGKIGYYGVTGNIGTLPIENVVTKFGHSDYFIKPTFNKILSLILV